MVELTKSCTWSYQLLQWSNRPAPVLNINLPSGDNGSLTSRFRSFHLHWNVYQQQQNQRPAQTKWFRWSDVPPPDSYIRYVTTQGWRWGGGRTRQTRGDMINFFKNFNVINIMDVFLYKCSKLYSNKMFLNVKVSMYDCTSYILRYSLKIKKKYKLFSNKWWSATFQLYITDIFILILFYYHYRPTSDGVGCMFRHVYSHLPSKFRVVCLREAT